MNLEELTCLANSVKNNEKVLKKDTLSLRDEVRDWCIEELKKIEAEEKKLLDFVNANKEIFIDKCGTPRFYSFGMCYTADKSSFGKVVNFSRLTMNDSCIHHKYEPFYNKISVYSWTHHCEGCFDCMNGDTEYWTSMKDVIDFRRYQLTMMTQNVKRIIESVLNEQKKRMDGIVKTCTEIDEERSKENELVAEVTIRVHRN